MRLSKRLPVVLSPNACTADSAVAPGTTSLHRFRSGPCPAGRARVRSRLPSRKRCRHPCKGETAACTSRPVSHGAPSLIVRRRCSGSYACVTAACQTPPPSLARMRCCRPRDGAVNISAKALSPPGGAAVIRAKALSPSAGARTVAPDGPHAPTGRLRSSPLEPWNARRTAFQNPRLRVRGRIGGASSCLPTGAYATSHPRGRPTGVGRDRIDHAGEPGGRPPISRLPSSQARGRVPSVVGCPPPY